MHSTSILIKELQLAKSNYMKEFVIIVISVQENQNVHRKYCWLKLGVEVPVSNQHLNHCLIDNDSFGFVCDI